MKDVYITISAFGQGEVLRNGQEYYIPISAAAGVDGIEIREELIRENDITLEKLRKIIEKENLECAYSAPVTLWNKAGELDKVTIYSTVEKALQVGARIVKISLGNYRHSNLDMRTLKDIMDELNIKMQNLLFTIENDQTSYGGNLSNLKQFFRDCEEYGLPIKMTFDIGNWNWTNENPIEAAEALGKYVVYIHFKHVECGESMLNTLPLPEDLNAEWRNILSKLPQDVIRTIEFPILGEDLTDETSKYVKLLAEA